MNKPARDSRPPERQSGPLPAWQPGTALVVDSDPVSRRFVELALGKGGEFVIEAAESAAAAIEILRVQAVELIIADTDLSDTNGLQFFRALSQESRLRGIPFLFLSADRRPEAKMAAFRAGVADYLIKPCHAGEFAARAISLVERERRARATARRRNYLLAGELTAMAFPDLVNTIEMARRSGVLSLVRAGGLRPGVLRRRPDRPRAVQQPGRRHRRAPPGRRDVGLVRVRARRAARSPPTSGRSTSRPPR